MNLEYCRRVISGQSGETLLFLLALTWQLQDVRQGRIPLKPSKVTIHLSFCNSESSVRDIRPFCRPLLCHSNVVKYTSFLLQ